MKHAFVLLISLIALQLQAQEGMPFPEMSTESLTHEIIQIPADIKGKYTLLCLAYSKKAESDLENWFSPIYNQFIREADPSNPFQFNYDINTYFIPMFTGAKRPAYKKVMKKVEKTVDPLIQPRLLFYEGTMSQYKHSLKLEDNSVPYFYILDPEGVIIHTTKGTYTDRKMQEVVNSVEPALSH